MWQRFNVRPAKDSAKPYETDAGYCIYSEAFNAYLYRERTRDEARVRLWYEQKFGVPCRTIPPRPRSTASRRRRAAWASGRQIRNREARIPEPQLA